MTKERTASTGISRIPLSLRIPRLSKRRVVLIAGLGTLAAGLALNWNWLTAVGVAPILLAVAPCAAMCALGLCMRGGGAKSCATDAKADVGRPPRSRQE
jgi:hypothetical protein